MPGPSFAKLQYMQALQTTKSRPAKGSGGMIPRYGGMLLRGIWESFDPSKDIPWIFTSAYAWDIFDISCLLLNLSIYWLFM